MFWMGIVVLLIGLAGAVNKGRAAWAVAHVKTAEVNVSGGCLRTSLALTNIPR